MNRHLTNKPTTVFPVLILLAPGWYDSMNKRNLVWIVVIIGLGFFVYLGVNKENEGYDGIVSGNGRIEAAEINIATKVAGRLATLSVAEGDFVLTGSKLASIDTTTLEAELHQAQAQFNQAQRAQLTQLKVKLSSAEPKKRQQKRY